MEIETNHWSTQIDHLVDAYLEYRANDSGDGMPATAPVASDDGACMKLVDIELVDMFCKYYLPSLTVFTNLFVLH